MCSIFSRDCSVQRRHQKIVEEGPVTAASPEVLEHMERCSRALARSVGYCGAATVEYLYALESKTYCFLELNPRLQVRAVVGFLEGLRISRSSRQPSASPHDPTSCPTAAATEP